MGWIILGLLLVFGLPVALVFMGVALALWVTLAVVGVVWSIVTFVFHSPVLAILLALGAGIAIGRGAARRERRHGPDPRRGAARFPRPGRPAEVGGAARAGAAAGWFHAPREQRRALLEPRPDRAAAAPGGGGGDRSWPRAVADRGA